MEKGSLLWDDESCLESKHRTSGLGCFAQRRESSTEKLNALSLNKRTRLLKIEAGVWYFAGQTSSSPKRSYRNFDR